MPSREEMAAFRKAWSLGPNNDPIEFERLKSRLLMAIATSVGYWIAYNHDTVCSRFAFLVGVPYRPYNHNYTWAFSLTQAADVLAKTSDLGALVDGLQRLLWAIEETDPAKLKALVPALNAAFDLSPNVLMRCVHHGGKATLHPGGAEILDEALIDDNLGWLAAYPTVEKPFVQALTMYLEKQPNEQRNLLDNLRFAVEQLLRVVLKNEKSLENQKDAFLAWLKDHGLHSSIISMYHVLLFDRFTKYQNDAVKHSEQYSPLEIEFMLYLTGTFIRLILRVDESQP
jgi:hypothetical protein